MTLTASEARPNRAHAQEAIYPKARTLQATPLDGGIPLDGGTTPPAYRTRTLEPVLNTRLTRVSDPVQTPKSAAAGAPKVIRHHYSRTQEWNSDGSLLMMGSQYLLDGKTYQKIGTYSEYSWETFWSHIHPDTMYAFSPPRAPDPTHGVAEADGALMKVTLSKNAQGEWAQTGAVALRTFPYAQFPEMAAGRGQGRLSEDDRYLALMARMGTTLRVLVIDASQAGAPTVAYQDFAGMWPSSGSLMEWCSVSPSGTYVVVAWSGSVTGANQGVEVFTRPSPNPTALLFGQRRLSGTAEAGDLCWEYNDAGTKGEETWVQIISGTQEGLYSADLVAWRLRTGDRLRMVARPTNPPLDFPGHVSCANYRRPGWAYVTAANDASISSSAVSQIFAIKVQDIPSGAPIPVETFARHHSNAMSPYNEAAQPEATADPFGQRVLFASNWNGNSASDVYGYVAERPNPIQLLPNPQTPTQVVVSSATHELSFYRQNWQALTLKTPRGTLIPATDLLFYTTTSSDSTDQLSAGYWMNPDLAGLSVSFQTLPPAGDASTAVIRAQRSGLTKTAYITVYPQDPLAYVVVRLTTNRPLKKIYDTQLTYINNQSSERMYASEIYLDGTKRLPGEAVGAASFAVYLPNKQATLAVMMAPASQQKLKVDHPVYYQYFQGAGSNMALFGLNYQPLNPNEVVEYRYAIYWNDDWQLDDVNHWAAAIRAGDFNDRFRTDCTGTGCICGDGVLGANEICDIELESGCQTDCAGHLTTATTEVSCEDGIDNDGDALVDCLDVVDCAGPSGASHCTFCGDALVSGDEVCDPAKDVLCTSDCLGHGDFVRCLNDNDCGVGQRCAVGDARQWKLGGWDNVCAPEICLTAAMYDNCGSLDAPCGLCPCTPNCSGKSCGDDLADGCGSLCSGVCGTGDDCMISSDCETGTTCIPGAARAFNPSAGASDSACMPASCLPPEPDAVDCGGPGSQCGACLDCRPNCAAATCGQQDGCGGLCPSGACQDPSTTCIAGTCITALPLIHPVLGSPLPDVDTTGATLLSSTAIEVTSTGSAHYSVPVPTPPGRAGLAPTLVLSYDSSGGYGYVGRGWTLQGLSRIHRCGRNLAQDGYSSGLDATDYDAYCLDGQRLIDAGDGAFRTEPDTFADISADASGSWTVRGKDGLHRIYEPLEAAADAFAAQNSRIWLLDRVVDRTGNAWKIHYGAETRDMKTSGDQMNNDSHALGFRYWPDYIVYTEHYASQSAHGNPDAPGVNKISFEYEDIPCRQFAESGVTLFQCKRLHAISASAGGMAAGTLSVEYDGELISAITRYAGAPPILWTRSLCCVS